MRDESPRPRPPASLGAAGKAFWRRIVADYALDPGELELLRQAVRVVDVLARLDAELLDADSLTVEGSVGQLRPHPLLDASALQRRTLADLLARLALPLPDEQEGVYKSPAALRAAQARWRSQREAG